MQYNKYAKKSISSLIRIAEEHFNRYIRHRDSQDECFKCISCGEYKDVSKMQAGHFMAAGHYSIVRFNEHNVNGQCEHCNTFLHGNLAKYNDNLIKKIGEDAVNLLKSTSRQVSKWDRTSLIVIIEEYKQKNKDYEI